MSHCTVLVIEDDEDTRLLMETALDMEGISSITSSGSAEAFAQLESGAAPALILLDLHLKGCSGAEFLEQLRIKPKFAQIKVVLVSGIADIAAKTKELGADGYLAKPFHLEKLFQTVKQFLLAN